MLRVSLFTVLLLTACGGRVVVDTTGDGTTSPAGGGGGVTGGGGAGGAGAMTGAGGCETLSCTVSPFGALSWNGTCGPTIASVSCSKDNDLADCACNFGGDDAIGADGACYEPWTVGCTMGPGCCGAIFAMYPVPQ
jgi:hypothetical protein